MERYVALGKIGLHLSVKPGYVVSARNFVRDLTLLAEVIPHELQQAPAKAEDGHELLRSCDRWVAGGAGADVNNASFRPGGSAGARSVDDDPRFVIPGGIAASGWESLLLVREINIALTVH